MSDRNSRVPLIYIVAMGQKKLQFSMIDKRLRAKLFSFQKFFRNKIILDRKSVVEGKSVN